MPMPVLTTVVACPGSLYTVVVKHNASGAETRYKFISQAGAEHFAKLLNNGAFPNSTIKIERK